MVLSDGDVQTGVNRAIAFEKAAEGFPDSILAPVMQDAAQQVQQAVIDQGVSPEAWSEVHQSILETAALSTPNSSDVTGGATDSTTQNQVTDENVDLILKIYGAQVGWQQRIGEMPALNAKNPSQMAAFVDVQRKIGDRDDPLSQRAQAIYEQLEGQGVTPDPVVLQAFQEQCEQFQADQLQADQPEAEEVIALVPEAETHPPDQEGIDGTSVEDQLVVRVSDVALDWLYEIGSNRYDGSRNTFTWNPSTRELRIEGEATVHAKKDQDNQWRNLGSEVDEAFVTSLEVHVRRQQELQQGAQETHAR